MKLKGKKYHDVASDLANFSVFLVLPYGPFYPKILQYCTVTLQRCEILTETIAQLWRSTNCTEYTVHSVYTF